MMNAGRTQNMGGAGVVGPWVPLVMAGLMIWASAPVHAHGGGDGTHLAVGYYFGHDENEDPADPAWPATLLVDTHPWELGDVYYDLFPTGGGLLNGWVSQVPGFEPLAVDDQEFGGHGFFSWLDPSYTLGLPDVRLHLNSVDAGLQVLNPDTLQSINVFNFGPSFPHTHLTYFVPASQGPVIGDVFTATFHLSDANGVLADSQEFTLQFRVVPEPATATLLVAAALLCVGRRKRVA